MVEITLVERKSRLLISSALACLNNSLAINLTNGCAHGCVYCYARGYSSYPGESRVIVYQNTLNKLICELTHKKNKPRMVYFSPSSDMFQPIPVLLDISHKILEYLFTENIGVAFLTKGFIPLKTLSLLADNVNNVRVQMGIITPDDKIRHIFEPKAAPINIRVKQMAEMVRNGIAVEARIMPIIPGVTDTGDSINKVFELISSIGIRHASLSTLFLRPAIVSSLNLNIKDKNMVTRILSFYIGNKRLRVKAKNSSIVPLNIEKRKEIYSRFQEKAEIYGVKLSVCGCMNPDLGGSCNITGKWEINSLQGNLFPGEELVL